VNLTEALASLDEVYSPRNVARMNDYDDSTTGHSL
jgi:hypothetical protein